MREKCYDETLDDDSPPLFFPPRLSSQESQDVKAALDAVSAAIGLTSEQLSRALTIRELVIRGESQLIQQEPDQASDSRDALAKAIYSVSLPFLNGSLILSVRRWFKKGEECLI